MGRMRKTKIIATVGPASSARDTLFRLMQAGVDCFRLNFSHGNHEMHGEAISHIRELSVEHGRHVGILLDLQGIKLRLGRIREPVRLNIGEKIAIVAEEYSDDPGVLPFPHPEILDRFVPGGTIYIADGMVALEVLEVRDSSVLTQVRNGGMVSDHKGVNLPGVDIPLPALTEKDLADIDFGVQQGVDWIAASFIRSAQEVKRVRSYMEEVGSSSLLMAKLERPEGVENLAEIMPEVDGIMVARGDLGIEIPMERVPTVQREMVHAANAAGKVAVVATQMLSSMVDAPRPKRAEVEDIASAVLQGCDAILLSEETAIGGNPVEVVRVADATIREAERDYPWGKSFVPCNRTQSIAAAASKIADEQDSPLLVITSTGRAVMEVSRFRPRSSVFVFSHDPKLLPKLALGWGLHPAGVVPEEPDIARLVELLIEEMLDQGFVSSEGIVTIVHGYVTGLAGTTSTLQVLNIQEYLENRRKKKPK